MSLLSFEKADYTIAVPCYFQVFDVDCTEHIFAGCLLVSFLNMRVSFGSTDCSVRVLIFFIPGCDVPGAIGNHNTHETRHFIVNVVYFGTRIVSKLADCEILVHIVMILLPTFTPLFHFLFCHSICPSFYNSLCPIRSLANPNFVFF